MEGLPLSRFLVIGGAHLDRRGQVKGPLHLHASNPGQWAEMAGGGAFNAARNLARLGHAVRLVAPRGGDPAGETVARAAADAGVEDTPITFLDRATPTYSAILDSHGDLVVALADMALYDAFSPRQCDRRTLRDAIADADAVLVDANLPEATIARLARRCDEAGRPLSAIAISPAKIVRLEPVLASLSSLFMNRREAEALVGPLADDWRAQAEQLRAAGIERGIVTAGAGAALAFDRHDTFLLPAIEGCSIVDVTGAGDALAAATLAFLQGGLTFTDACRHGVAAASLVVESAEPAPPGLTLDAVRARLALVPPIDPLHLKR